MKQGTQRDTRSAVRSDKPRSGPIEHGCCTFCGQKTEVWARPSKKEAESPCICEACADTALHDFWDEERGVRVELAQQKRSRR